MRSDEYKRLFDDLMEKRARGPLSPEHEAALAGERSEVWESLSEPEQHELEDWLEKRKQHWRLMELKKAVIRYLPLMYAKVAATGPVGVDVVKELLLNLSDEEIASMVAGVTPENKHRLFELLSEARAKARAEKEKKP